MDIAGKIRQGLLLNAITLVLWPFYGDAETFNSSLLVGDPSQREWGAEAPVIAPGSYELDIYIDDEWKGKYPVNIGDGAGHSLSMKKRDILLLGINELRHLDSRQESDDIVLDDILHGGKSVLHTGELRLDLEIPQAYVTRNDKNWVPPALWDQGINGLYTNYNLNAYSGQEKGSGGGTSRSAFLSLQSGLNLFGWRLLDNSTWYQDSRNGSQWSTSSRYAEKPIAPLTTLLRAGEMYSSSDYFDSIAFRGITLSKDMQMLPDKDQVYMPVVSGNATSNAVVSVSQNNKVIYQITVPAGPFAIRDLMPTGSRDDLEIEVRNSGGLTERFTVPFATMSSMLRPGSADFRVNLGKVHAPGSQYTPWFGQADYSRGINNYWTWFNGLTVSQNYASLLMGSTASFPWIGSLTASAEQTRWRNDDKNQRGEKYSLAWSKYLPTHTNITLATWYYRTRDYVTLSEAVDRQNHLQASPAASSKQAFSVSLSQPLGDNGGRFALDAWFRDYRGGRTPTRQYNLSYSNSVHKVNYMVALGRSDYSRTYGEDRDASRRSETNVTFSVSVPFSLFGTPVNMNARTRLNNGRYSTSNLGFSGTSRDVDYSLDLAHDRDGTLSTDAYSGWKTSWARFNAGISNSADYRQFAAGASGSLLAWSGGVLAGPEGGNNFVIVEAPGVEGAEINSDSNQKTNRRGQALISGAVAYRMNQFWLNTDNSKNPDVDVQGNIAHIAPYEGSITRVKYKTDIRKLFILRLRHADGAPVSFGSMIYDAGGHEVGYVAQGSQAFIKADALPEELHIGQKTPAGNCLIVRPDENHTNVCTVKKGAPHA